MTDTAVPPSLPAHGFRPPNAESLWKQLSAPHPTVGKARHLGEALIHAGMLSPSALQDGLQAQQQERSAGQNRLIGQIQPQDAIEESPLGQVAHHKVGRLGRLTQFEQSRDGR